MGDAVDKVIDTGKKAVGIVTGVLTGGFNPWVALGVFAIGWLFSRKPDIPDFGDNEFNNYEKGVLLNYFLLYNLQAIKYLHNSIF